MQRFQTGKRELWTILHYAKNKKLVIFGTGVKAKSFFEFHLGHIPIYAVIDNDTNKQGRTLGSVLKNLNDPVNEALLIDSVGVLHKYDDDDVFIFIANATPEPLIQQLREMGKNHFLTFEKWWNLQMEFPYQFDVDNHKIVFIMYMHGAHEKAITQELLRYRSTLDIVWIVDRMREDVPLGVRVLTTNNMYDCRCEAATAGIWVTGLEILDDCFQKRKNQFYLQVKHWSSLTLKVFGPECNRRIVSEEEYNNIVKVYKANNKKMDVVLTGSKFDEESCRQGWKYSGKFVRVGSPRSDIMFDAEAGSRVYAHLGIDPSIHLAMYAPTFRWPFTSNQPFHSLNFEKLYHSLKKRFGGDWRILLRLHPLVADQAEKIDLPFYVVNASNYDDSEELTAAADITITDYSSIMFEPAFVYKPVFLYAPDKEKYQSEHPLLLEYDKLPFPVCADNQTLEQAIFTFNENEYRLKLREMFDTYDVHEDGHASERAAMYILGLIDAKSGLIKR